MMNLKQKALRMLCVTAAAAVMSAMILTSCAGMPEAPASSGSTSSGTSASSGTSTPASSAPASSSQPASSGVTEENSPSSSTASSTAQANTVAAYQQEVLRLVNIERQKAGVAPLTMNNTALTAAAMKRAEETQSLFSHTRPNGTSCFTVLTEYKVAWKYICGENIAKGQRTPAEVVDDWMHSEGHRANILNGS